jgi:CheY-like chemotaxis protein
MEVVCVNQSAQDVQTIVVIEDDGDNAEFFQEMIATETPYRAWVISSAEEAVARIEEIKACNPRLFIIDYLLTGKTGLDLYDEFQHIEAFSAVPAILTTASYLEPLQEEITKRGVSVIAKPFEMDAFLQLIKQILDPS